MKQEQLNKQEEIKNKINWTDALNRSDKPLPVLTIQSAAHLNPDGTKTEYYNRERDGHKELEELLPQIPDDWNELQQSQVLYGKEESREFELERENERLLIVVDMQQLEIENLRKQLYSALPGLQSLPNNY